MKWITISIQGLMILAIPALDVNALFVTLGCLKRWRRVFRSVN